MSVLQDICNALPVAGCAEPRVAEGGLHAYSDVLQHLISATVEQQRQKQQTGPTNDAAADTAPGAVQTHGCEAPGAAVSQPSAPANRWQRAAAASGAKVPQFSSKKAEQVAAAFGAVLSQAVTSERGQIARWCSTLVVARQTGRAIAGLHDSVNQLLPQLPWAVKHG